MEGTSKPGPGGRVAPGHRLHTQQLYESFRIHHSQQLRAPN